MTYSDYLTAERRAEVRHEYLRGQVWAMAGGTIEHGRLASALAGELRSGLRGRPCAVFSSDVRIRVEATDRATYPDLSVACGKRETAKDDDDALTNPMIIVEVLSDSTEADDRGQKFAHYRQLTSLREYVLVSQHEPRIEVFRCESGRWALYEAGAHQSIRLESIDVELVVDEVFRDPLA
ncbi:MAG: Uma2 family endonuclease [Polyangiales bacterium]